MRESKRKEAKGKVENKEVKKDESEKIKEVKGDESEKIKEVKGDEAKKIKEVKEEKVKETKTKNNEKNNNKYKCALKNIIIGCGVIIYFVILLFGKGMISNIDYIMALKVCIVCDLIASIILLEVGFRKDKFSIGLHGIEMAIVGGVTIYILDMFCKTKENFNICFSAIVAFISVYFIAKSIVIALKKEK